MKIEHAVMRLKWMIFGVALLLGCVLFNQVTLLALVGFIMVLCNLILLGVETPKEKKEPAEEDEKPVQKISQIDPFFRHYEDIETRKR